MEEGKELGVDWQLLSHFHRQPSQPGQDGGQGWVEIGELSVLGAGLPQGLSARGVGGLPAGSGLPGVCFLQGSVVESYWGPWQCWEHSRGAFQPSLSNAWLLYSSWHPLKHTRSGSTQALSPGTSPLKT